MSCSKPVVTPSVALVALSEVQTTTTTKTVVYPPGSNLEELSNSIKSKYPNGILTETTDDQGYKTLTLTNTTTADTCSGLDGCTCGGTCCWC